jgi:putative transposase
MFEHMLEYKLAVRGGLILSVPAQHSSNTCSECEHVDSENRVSRDLFRCAKCGNEEHADVNAAKVILQRALRKLVT